MKELGSDTGTWTRAIFNYNKPHETDGKPTDDDNSAEPQTIKPNWGPDNEEDVLNKQLEQLKAAQEKAKQDKLKELKDEEDALNQQAKDDKKPEETPKEEPKKEETKPAKPITPDVPKTEPVKPAEPVTPPPR